MLMFMKVKQNFSDHNIIMFLHIKATGFFLIFNTYRAFLIKLIDDSETMLLLLKFRSCGGVETTNPAIGHGGK